LLPDVIHEAFGRDRKLPNVCVCMVDQQIVPDICNIDCVIDRHFVVHRCRLS
jgi:hypothetical protein